MVQKTELQLGLRLGVACLWQKESISKQSLLLFALKECVALDRVVNNRNGLVLKLGNNLVSSF